ncbi:hypothetical protein V1517DRAFT_333944 [Lipomyces orientalis]|uniref:Uncharacterized protein n=1 Tax=Lipomyces orientalis TaxID=1233043 RepID=A0ACC3TFV9_9ASCO
MTSFWMTMICGSMARELKLLYWYTLTRRRSLIILAQLHFRTSQIREQKWGHVTIRGGIYPSTQLNIQHSYYGPLEYRGHPWADKLEEAYIEVWRQDTRLANNSIQSTGRSD